MCQILAAINSHLPLVNFNFIQFSVISMLLLINCNMRLSHAMLWVKIVLWLVGCNSCSWKWKKLDWKFHYMLFSTLASFIRLGNGREGEGVLVYSDWGIFGVGWLGPLNIDRPTSTPLFLLSQNVHIQTFINSSDFHTKQVPSPSKDASNFEVLPHSLQSIHLKMK